MESLLERELELAAQRRGISKSQFIIEAVESALGHKDPGQLLLQVREEFAPLRAAEAAAGGALLPPGSHAERLRAVLRERHEADLRDWSLRTKPPVQGREESSGRQARTAASQVVPKVVLKAAPKVEPRAAPKRRSRKP
jgi:RHH-type rel operon transcriptional repressor/antitoxin RelB